MAKGTRRDDLKAVQLCPECSEKLRQQWEAGGAFKGGAFVGQLKFGPDGLGYVSAFFVTEADAQALNRGLVAIVQQRAALVDQLRNGGATICFDPGDQPTPGEPGRPA